MYRASVLFDNLDDYVNSGTNGDDRRLSLYSLIRRVRLADGRIVKGKVVAVNTAHVYTDMPTKAADLWRQRLRWGKSGWQSLPFEITNLSFVPLAFRLYALALAVVLPIMYVWVGISIVLGGHYKVLMIALAASMVIRYGETSLYAMIRPGLTGWQRFAMWLVMTPIAFAMNWFIIRPAKYWALTQLNKRGWVTRGNAHGTVVARPRRRRLALQLGAAVVAILGGGGFTYAGIFHDDQDTVVTEIAAPALVPTTGTTSEPTALETLRPTLSPSTHASDTQERSTTRPTSRNAATHPSLALAPTNKNVRIAPTTAAATESTSRSQPTETDDTSDDSNGNPESETGTEEQGNDGDDTGAASNEEQDKSTSSPDDSPSGRQADNTDDQDESESDLIDELFGGLAGV